MKKLFSLLVIFIFAIPFQLKAEKTKAVKFLDQVRVIPYFKSESFLPGVGTIIQYKLPGEISFLELDVGVSSISLNAGLKTTLSIACQFDEKKQNISIGLGVFDYKLLVKEKSDATLILPVAYGYMTEGGNYFKVGVNTFVEKSNIAGQPFVKMGHIF
jgi:hypothetical protein